MNQLLQLEHLDDKEVLVYHYKKIQDIDDVILQLLNEADIDGFIKSSLNKAMSAINYDVTGYTKWSEIPADQVNAEMMAAVMENLYQLLAYLEDSFIDIEYVMLDTAYLYVDPVNGRLQLLVLPCQEAVDEEYSLTDCVQQMLALLPYGQEQWQDKLDQGIRSLNELNALADILRTLDKPAPKEQEQDQMEAEPEVQALEVTDEEHEENEEIEAIQEIETPSESVNDVSVEEIRQSLEKELTEKIRASLRQEIEDELRESMRAELEQEQALTSNTNEKMPYLIRKKTGEIICLNKQTFIIGKLDTVCDYVIRGNHAISRLHAVIKYKESTDTYYIVDCNSTNHIYLNGRQIEAEQPEPLTDGLHIHLALEEFVFKIQ